MSHTGSDEQYQYPFLTRAYNLTSVEGARALYDEWATSYDKDLQDPSHDWVAPGLAAAALLDFFSKGRAGSGSFEVLDAGCGTGIVGTTLVRQSEAKQFQPKPDIDGVDLSTGMLDVARKTGAYRSLSTADMSKALDIKDHQYDAVTCVGVLTKGHVGPDVIREFARVLKQGGCLVATVREDIWESGGYKAVIDELERDQRVQLISADSVDSLKGAGITMKLPILKRL